MKLTASKLNRIILEEQKKIRNEKSMKTLNRIIKEEYARHLKSKKNAASIKILNRIIKEELRRHNNSL
jgi:hypothetical protein